MKKVINIFMLLTFMMMPVKGFAANVNATVNIKIQGEVKVGNEIEIHVDVENVDNLYAISTDFRYDTSIIQVTSIEGGTFIKGDGENQMEVPAKIDNGRASYGITLIGDVPTRKGKGNITTIKAKVLKDTPLKINGDNIFVKLVERTDDKEIKEINYTLNGTEGKGAEVTGDQQTTGGDTTSTEKPNHDNFSDANTSDKNENSQQSKDDNEEKDVEEKGDIDIEKSEDIVENEAHDSEDKNNSSDNSKNTLYVLGTISTVIIGGYLFYHYKNKK